MIQFFSTLISTSGTRIIFPIPFIDINYYVTITAGTSGNVICSTTFSTTDKTKEHIKAFSEVNTGKADIIAIGFWK